MFIEALSLFVRASFTTPNHLPSTSAPIAEEDEDVVDAEVPKGELLILINWWAIMKCNTIFL